MSALHPLASLAGEARLRAVLEHHYAPRWNRTLGDRIEASDRAGVDAYRELVAKADGRVDREALIERLRVIAEGVPFHARRIPHGTAWHRDWEHLPTMRREDLARDVATLVPSGADLSRLIVYDTSGTTGHALRIPHHAGAMAKNHALVERALADHNASPTFNSERAACFHVRAQKNTWVFANLFTVWNERVFAKVNLAEADWSQGLGTAQEFFGDLDPELLTGDPVAFAEMARLGIDVRPRAMISTAVQLAPRLAAQLQERYGCPVIDWYSTTETGPIAYAAPDGALRLVAPDLLVEVLDPEGFLVRDGERGEITVSGGRNPFLPLVRYRTGDFARRVGDGIAELSGRASVILRAGDGSLVNPVDVGRIMRLTCAFVQHAIEQRADGSVTVRIAPFHGVPVDAYAITSELRTLFGAEHPIEVQVVPELGDGAKVITYRSEIS